MPIKITANQVFDGSRFLENDQVLVVDESGKVLDIISEAEGGEEIKRLPGLLTPGLVNCHCHLELSHLKNQLPAQTGLITFLCNVVTRRAAEMSLVLEAINMAEEEMWKNGIVAVGDIGNTADTIATKKQSRIRWHNFVEVLSFTDEGMNRAFDQFGQVEKAFLDAGFDEKHTVLCPHAPYSISIESFKKLNTLTRGRITSMHNQENPAEDELYLSGKGNFLSLFSLFGVNQSPFPVTGTTSIRHSLPFFQNDQTLLLVHNSFMSEDDIRWANQQAQEQGISLYYCFCPNANLYIEDRVPAIQPFIDAGCNIVLGTDSYSSNWQLSIAKEIETLQREQPSLELSSLLQWATLNGARALGWDKELGSFEKGKSPGFALFTGNGQSERIDPAKLS